MGKVLDSAIEFAIKAHSGQTRKGGGMPYVLHPMETAVIAAELTRDEEVIAAAILHDVVEDSGVEPEEIRERFGKRVAALVAAETEDKMRDRPAAETWRERKEASLRELAATDDRGVKILWLADKLSNMRSVRDGVMRDGAKFFDVFNQKDPAQHEWYYRAVAKELECFAGEGPYEEFRELIDNVFKKEM